MKSPDQTRAECAAREARVLGHFDRIDAEMQRIFGMMKADGLIREPGSRTRSLDGLGYAPGSEPMPERAA